MNEHISKFYPGQTVKLNLPKDPITYEKVKIDGVMKSVPVTEPVDCEVKGVNYAEGRLDFSRRDQDKVVFRNYIPTEKDVVVKDVPRAKVNPDELPVIRRVKPGEKVVLALPKEPIKYVKKDGKMVPDTEDVPCVVHSVNTSEGTISFTRKGSEAIFRNFKVTDENLVQDEAEAEKAEAKKAAKGKK